MHLERLIHTQGFGSRKECRRLIRAGRVAVGGVVCDDPFTEFTAEGLTFNVDGQDWRWCAKAVLILNKPTGYECSHQPKHHRSVFTLLPPPLVERGVQSIGRLDEDTSGLLLFTDDGQLIHAVSSGRRKVPKTYRVTVKHPMTLEQRDQLLAGVVLNDAPEPVCAATAVLCGNEKLLLTVREGRYHQVRRMLAAVGNRVEALERIAVGGLQLPTDLAPGAWRWLEETDLEALWSFAGDAADSVAKQAG